MWLSDLFSERKGIKVDIGKGIFPMGLGKWHWDFQREKGLRHCSHLLQVFLAVSVGTILTLEGTNTVLLWGYLCDFNCRMKHMAYWYSYVRAGKLVWIGAWMRLSPATETMEKLKSDLFHWRTLFSAGKGLILIGPMGAAGQRWVQLSPGSPWAPLPSFSLRACLQTFKKQIPLWMPLVAKQEQKKRRNHVGEWPVEFMAPPKHRHDKKLKSILDLFKLATPEALM